MSNDEGKRYLQVAVCLPVSGTFTYCVSNALAEQAEACKRVLVPFSQRTVVGYILRVIPPENRSGIKDIVSVLDPHPLFPQNMVPFFEWLSSYYHYPLGMVIKAALPSGLNVTAASGDDPTDAGWHDRVRILKRTYVSVAKDSANKPTPAGTEAIVPRLLSGHGRGAANESEFLELMYTKGELPLMEIARKFPNGRYLVDKWVKKGIVAKSLKPIMRGIEDGDGFLPPEPPSLNSTQTEIVEEVEAKLREGSYAGYLLHGVTGSGKTEVYYHAVRAAIQLGKQSIIMVPEIALTVAMASLFKARLNERVAVVHSALSQGERYEQWISIARGEADVVIGARSALFAPLPRLGLIIVDEEHDSSYKQEEKFHYQARDAAVMRSKLLNTVVILGSGTPSVQSYHNAAQGKYELLSMPERVGKKMPPEITMIDMSQFEDTKSAGILSPPLQEAIRENLAKGEQAILFLNRRGFSILYLCRFCGTTVRCPNCELSLTYHKDSNTLLCHYCGFRIQPPQRCPSCGREQLKPYGFGTERLVEAVTEIFPEARVERMDRDTMRHKGKVQQVLKRFRNKEVDVLVGTQMVTKGHDFPNVSLVGVISADLSLNWPDFRAGETTFQLVSQVAGRTGRGSSPGRVIIQTYNPSHYAICAARDYDYKGFFSREVDLRRRLRYPPFSSIANLRFLGNSKSKTEHMAGQMKMRITEMIQSRFKGKKDLEVLGPVEAPIAKLKNKYRQQILIKSRRPKPLNQLLNDVNRLSSQTFGSSGVKLIIDVDPYQMV